MRQTRRWLPYFGALVLVGLIVAGLWPQPVPVETARAAFGPLRTTVNEEGKTRIRHRFVVSAPVTGQLRRIGLKAGAEVLGNETVVATLDPISPALLDARTRSLAEARRDSAAANLEKARAAHEFAASELKRFEKLHRDGTVSIQEWEAAQWREASASRDRAAADSALRQAEAELAVFAAGSSTNHPGNPAVPPVEVRAPTSGRVLRVFEENARVVGVGSPLLEIGDPADLEVVVEVLSRDAAVIRPGARVQLDQWGGSQPLEARVRLIEPAGFTKVSALGVEEQRVNVIADLVSPPELRANLGDAFRVVARIVTSETDRALCVPSGALFRRGDAWAVFVVNHRRAHLRRVQAGRSSGMETEVVEGLQEGDAVVLYPGDRIRDGQRVKRLAI
jgi:HlyD family secretion protein